MYLAVAHFAYDAAMDEEEADLNVEQDFMDALKRLLTTHEGTSAKRLLDTA